MTDGDGRPLIDDQGRIFGTVNIVDALVVLFVAVLVIGGVWFVATAEGDANGEAEPEAEPEPEPEPEPETAIRYATLDLGTVSPQLASEITVGDTVGIEDDNLTITDSYRAPVDDEFRVFVRVELEGVLREVNGTDRFEFDGAAPRIDRELTLETDRYETTGQIQAVSEDGTELERVERETVLDVELSATALETLEVGDEFVVGEESIATIETVEAHGTGNPDIRSARVGITYRTVAPPAGVRPVFGTTTVREGATLPFETDTYDFTGEIQRLGALEPRGEVATRTATLVLEDVSEHRAEQFEAGMAETVAGETVAELTDVEVERIDSEERDRRSVTMTAELRVRETTAGPRFKNEPLRVDESITLEFERTTAEVTVVDRE